MSKQYELVIIGSGPAGLTAAIYASRARIECVVIEQNVLSGGQILNTYEVDNYPGLPGISGLDLGNKMREHADRFGIEFLEDYVKSVEEEGEFKKVNTGSGEIITKAVVIATGASHRLLGIPGEEELSGMGVSYCATCDGAFFKEKEVFVIGGGDTAIEDALFLSRICARVNLVHRRGSLRGNKAIQEKLFNTSNVNIIWDSIPEKIFGEEKVESIAIKNIKNNEISYLDADGVFVAIGIEPNKIGLPKELDLTPDGYIIADESCATSIPGIFAAGDIRNKNLRQIVTAVADGANAITSVERFL